MYWNENALLEKTSPHCILFENLLKSFLNSAIKKKKQIWRFLLLLCSLGNKWPLTEMFEVSLILKWLKKLTFIVAEWPRLIISHRQTTTCRTVGMSEKIWWQTEIEGGFKENVFLLWLPESRVGGTRALSAPRFRRPWHALFRDPRLKEMRLTKEKKVF